MSNTNKEDDNGMRAALYPQPPYYQCGEILAASLNHKNAEKAIAVEPTAQQKKKGAVTAYIFQSAKTSEEIAKLLEGSAYIGCEDASAAQVKEAWEKAQEAGSVIPLI